MNSHHASLCTANFLTRISILRRENSRRQIPLNTFPMFDDLPFETTTNTNNNNSNNNNNNNNNNILDPRASTLAPASPTQDCMNKLWKRAPLQCVVPLCLSLCDLRLWTVLLIQQHVNMFQYVNINFLKETYECRRKSQDFCCFESYSLNGQFCLPE